MELFGYATLRELSMNSYEIAGGKDIATHNEINVGHDVSAGKIQIRYLEIMSTSTFLGHKTAPSMCTQDFVNTA